MSSKECGEPIPELQRTCCSPELQRERQSDNQSIRWCICRASQVVLESIIILVELVLTMVWSITRDFPSRRCILEKFPDSMEFQSCKMNIKTDVCSKTVDPHITMQRIKEVDIAKSIDDLVTSRSNVRRTDFPDDDMLDEMIASALKKLLGNHVHFRKRLCVEEQRAQRYDRFLRGRQIA